MSVRKLSEPLVFGLNLRLKELHYIQIRGKEWQTTAWSHEEAIGYFVHQLCAVFPRLRTMSRQELKNETAKSLEVVGVVEQNPKFGNEPRTPHDDIRVSRRIPAAARRPKGNKEKQ